MVKRIFFEMKTVIVIVLCTVVTAPCMAQNVNSASSEVNISTAGTNSPLVIIDGEKGCVENFDASQIESLSVLKNEYATAAYGEQGANGVVVVKTKNGQKKSGKSALVIIDGKKGCIDNIDASQLESLHVLKNESATAAYGEQGENGVIAVVTKNGQNNESKLFYMNCQNSDGQPLTVIDGREENDREIINSIDPAQIESLSVLKNEPAVAAYGEKAANGVVVIKTKDKMK